MALAVKTGETLDTVNVGLLGPAAEIAPANGFMHTVEQSRAPYKSSRTLRTFS